MMRQQLIYIFRPHKIATWYFFDYLSGPLSYKPARIWYIFWTLTPILFCMIGVPGRKLKRLHQGSLWLELWRKFPTTQRLPHKPSGPCDHLRREVPSWGKVWSFKQCQINGTVYYSKSYKVIARNNFTVNFSGKKRSENGFVLNYVKFRGSVNRHLVEIRTVTANWH